MAKTWLITGSSRGMGRALAESVLASGDNLVATARNVSGQALTAPFGNRAIIVPLDVANFPAACKAVEAAVSTFGRLDVVANVAGYGNLGPVEDTSFVLPSLSS